MVDRYNKVICEYGTDDGIERDIVVNTWHFRQIDIIPGTTPEDSANDMVDQLEEFYQLLDSEWFPDEMGNTIIARVYDMEAPEPRVPIIERTIAITNTGVSGLPHELAVCLSFRAEYESGSNKARRRGRVYIGPLVPAARELVGNKIAVSSGFTTDLRDAAVAAFQTGLAVQDPRLCVYSRRDDETGASVADSFHEAIECWVDNAWDVQRRRGVDATTRLTGALS